MLDLIYSLFVYKQLMHVKWLFWDSYAGMKAGEKNNMRYLRRPYSIESNTIDEKSTNEGEKKENVQLYPYIISMSLPFPVSRDF